MRDLVPGPGTEAKPPALGAWSLYHCTTREVPKKLLKNKVPILNKFAPQNEQKEQNSTTGAQLILHLVP